MNLLLFALLGLGLGAAYVLLGQGIVLIYRGSGLLNFAQGGIALLAAEMFYRTRANLHWPLPVSLITALALAAVMGWGMQVGILQRLRDASALVRLMTTIGLFTFIEGLGTILWGIFPAAVNGFLPTTVVSFGGRLHVGANQLALLGIALVLTVVLWLVYQRTRYGLATSAVSENSDAVVLLGWSANRVAALNWVLGSLLAGLAGILLAPISGLSVDVLTLSVIPGLAAALMGSFSSFWLTFGGGVAIGIAQSELTFYVHDPGWSDSVPFLIIIAILVLRGRALPLRGEYLDRPPRVGQGTFKIRWVVVAVVVAGLAVYWLSYSWELAVSATALFGIVALSLVLITGYAGQISLAQLTLAGIGALAAGNASAIWRLPFLVCVLFGVVAAMGVGVVFGLPALRCRGANLAVVTIGMSLAIEQLVLQNPWLTGGAGGLSTRTPALFGIDVAFNDYPARYTILVIIAFALSALAVANIRRSRTGRRLLALRFNERAATSCGVNVLGAKLYAFAVGAGLAGLAGALADFQLPQVSLANYNTIGSIQLVVNTMTGGIGYVGGAVGGGFAANGGVLSTVLSYLPGNLTADIGAIGGAAVLVVLVTRPHGIYDALFERRRTKNERGRTAAAPALVGPPAGGRQASAAGRGRTLSVRDLSVSFGAVHALSHVDLEVRPGEVVGLIGPNGAGKTTLIDAICGLVRSTGTVRLGDADLSRLSPRRRVLAGLGRTFQTVELFDDMTVFDNVRVAADGQSLSSYLLDPFLPRSSALPEVALSAISDLDLGADLGRNPDELPTGRRQLAGIARGLARAPGVVLLDEPAAGLNDEERRELARLVRHLADRWALAVLLIEHDVQFVTNVSDRVVALALGEVVAEGPPVQVLGHEKVIAAYLGDMVEAAAAADSAEGMIA